MDLLVVVGVCIVCDREVVVYHGFSAGTACTAVRKIVTRVRIKQEYILGAILVAECRLKGTSSDGQEYELGEERDCM